MRLNLITIAMIAAAATCIAAAEQAPATGKPAGGKPATATSPAKPESPKPDARRCMVCGATCGLTPICVCKSGTKKQPRTTFKTTCEPICVAGCGSKPWPFARPREGVGCTGCCEQDGRCPGWVRNRKTLTRETVDEEVPTIERRVGFICCACAGDGPTASRTRGGCLDGPERREAGSWPWFARWLKLW